MSQPIIQPADRKLYHDFGDRLQIARKHLGWTQAEFAAQLRVSPTSYCQCERGNANPSLPLLRNLKKWTGRSVDWFLGLES